MDKNRIRGLRHRTSGQLIAKSSTIKGAGGKFGGCALKVVILIAGGLLHVPESGLRKERSFLIVQQKSAAGTVVHVVGEAVAALQAERRSNR
ncbi:MAG: hypothetical protein P4K97_00360 [Terracidiphilus sp.]|nr:hypothetical protein [Terracidiphilus sp.]